MKILTIYRHYWPDTTPYARILRTIAEHFAAHGHEVTVYSAQPSYNDVRQEPQPWHESLNGVDVHRIRLLPERKRWRLARAVNYAHFLLRSIAHAVAGRRYDLVIANSHPPVFMGCALRVIRALRGTPYIYHCEDLHPESAALVGDLGRGWLYRTLMELDTATCRDARRVVVLSGDMADALTARGHAAKNVSIINNPPLPVDRIEQRRIHSPLAEPGETVRFLFAGNLGRFQGLERLVAAARLIAGHVRFQLIFMGEGAAKRELITLAGDLMGRRIVFMSQQSVEAAVAAMRVCDYGVVSLLANVYRFAYPSKCIMYLSAGCPVVSLVEPESELARTIEQHNLGYVARSRSVLDIAEIMTRAVAERHRWTASRRSEIERKCEELFGESRMLEAWMHLISGEVPRGGTDRVTSSRAA
jgi:glycosyltransferase involved in cell wall biosynthesis